MDDYERLIHEESERIKLGAIEREQRDLNANLEKAKQKEATKSALLEEERLRRLGSPLLDFFNEKHSELLQAFLQDAKSHGMKGSTELTTSCKLIRQGIWNPLTADYMFAKKERTHTRGYVLGIEEPKDELKVYLCEDGALRVDDPKCRVKIGDYSQEVSRPLKTQRMLVGLWQKESGVGERWSNFYEDYLEYNYIASVFYEKPLEIVIARMAINSFR